MGFASESGDPRMLIIDLVFSPPGPCVVTRLHLKGTIPMIIRKTTKHHRSSGSMNGAERSRIKNCAPTKALKIDILLTALL